MKHRLLFLFFSISLTTFSQTNVSGVIQTNTTWNNSGSPYIVTGSILIPNGLTLSIEPGVTILFNGPFKLLVQGRILALGNSSDSIIFKPNTGINSWGGIRFDNTPSTNDTSLIRYSALRSAKAPGGTEIDGGAIYLNNHHKLKIHNTKFTDCKADNSYDHPSLGGKGGGVALFNSSIKIIESTFDKCNGNVQGGAIFSSYSNCYLVGLNISNSKAIYKGGGVRSEYSTLILKDSFITSDSARESQLFGGSDGIGGGVSINACLNCSIEGNVISQNYSKNMGGGIHIEGGNVSLISNIINSNYSNTSGGGIFLQSYNPNSILINQNTVDSNTANQNGGGLFIAGWGQQDSIRIVDCFFRYNASNQEGGGIRSNRKLHLEGVSLVHNTAQNNGGAIHSYGHISINRSLIHSNFSNLNGGGIFCDKRVNIRNSQITNNECIEKGGALALYSAELKYIINSTIYGNKAFVGGGLYLESGASPTIANSIFYANNIFTSSQNNLNQIHINDQQSQPLLVRNSLQGGITNITTNGNIYTGINSNNIDVNPRFVSPSQVIGLTSINNNLSLQDSSLLINQGDTTYLNLNYNKDFIGNNRVIGCLPDIGASENIKFLLNPFIQTQGSLQVFGNKCDTSRLISTSIIDSNAQYSWYYNNNPINSNSLSHLALNPGSYYTISSIPNSGCGMQSLAAYVNLTPKLSIISSFNNAICHGDSTGNINSNIVSLGISNITWANSSGQTVGNSTSLTNVPGGVYLLTVTDTGGCQTTKPFIISQPPQIGISATAIPASCFGNPDGQLSISVSNAIAPYSITWTGSSSNNDTLTGLSSGSYTATILDSNLCSNSATFSVSQPNAISIQALTTTNVSCFQGQDGAVTVEVTGGNGGYVSQWKAIGTSSALSNSMTLSGVAAGNYRHIVVDSKGCTDSIDITILQPIAPLSATISSQVDVLCFGASTGSLSAAALGGTVGTGYSFQWRNNANNVVSNSSIASGMSAGVYTCQITDVKGCTTQISDTITQPSSAVSLTSNGSSNVSCFGGNNGLAWVSPIGGVSPYSYSWSTSSINDSITSLIAGSYTVTVTDNNGCSQSQSFSITQPTLLTNTYTSSTYYGGTNVSCPGGSNGSIDLTPSGGTTPYTYLWSNNSQSQDPNGLSAGVYSVTITDFKGCQSTRTVTLTDPADFVWTNSITDVSCNGLENGAISLGITGGNSPFQLNWNTTANQASKTEVTFRVDMSQQSISSLGIGSVFQGVVGILSLNDLYGDSVFIGNKKFNPGDTIYWRYFNGSNSETVPLACGAITSLSVFERFLVVPDHDTILPIICFSSCTNCNGINGPGQNGTVQTSSKTMNNLGAGNYNFSLIDRNGCISSQSATVAQPSQLIASTTSQLDPTCPQNSDGLLSLEITGGTTPYTLLWNNGTSNDTLTNIPTGNYWVNVQDANGCSDSLFYTLTAPEPFDFEEICVLSVDSATGKNLVVWNKTPNQRTLEYRILKENSQGQFVQIGNQPYLNLSLFTDQSSTPQAQPDRYKIALVDSCGNLSDTSEFHRTIHLQSNLGSSGEVNLSWTAYQGKPVQSYEIWRWITSGNLVQIATVAASVNSYTDLNPPVAANVYYVINAIFSSTCSPTSGKNNAFDISKSNILNQTGIGIREADLAQNVKLYPNPTNGSFQIEFIGNSEFEKLRVYDNLGRLIYHTSVKNQPTVIDLNHEPSGTYRVEVIGKTGIAHLPLVIQK